MFVSTTDARPVAAAKPEIIAKLQQWSRLVCQALPGGGKTTLLPRIALEAFPECNVIVTLPRRRAVINAATRMAEELDTEVGDVIGYRIGKGSSGKSQKVGRNTRVEFMTDALLMQRLHTLNDNTVLMLDEVDVWNRNMSALLAVARKKIRAGSKMKLIVTSATLPRVELAEFLDAPDIHVDGTMFDITDLPQGVSFEGDIVDMLAQGHNVLVFEPGKKDIDATIQHVRNHYGDSVVALPLYSELDDAEQRKCFVTYDKPVCIVATDIAETSLTIPGITAVIDRGTAKVVVDENGVERLQTIAISRSRGWQRRGRAGRVCEGFYIDWCLTPWDERPEHDVPEILRLRLEKTVLHLGMLNVDAAGLEFFPPHQPDVSKIRQAKKSLRALGCLDSAGEVTDIGRRVADLPVAVHCGRMIVEGERLGVVDDVVTAVALIEQGGVNDRVCGVCKAADKNTKSCDHWRELVQGETESDVMAQHAMYMKAKALKTPRKMFDKGISSRAVGMVDAIRREILEAIDAKPSKRAGDRDAVLQAVCAGMVEHLYAGNGRGFSNVDDGTARWLDRSSIVDGNSAKWLVGFPNGFRPNQLLMATKVDPFWLPELAPHLVDEVRTGIDPRYDASLDEVVSTTEIWIDGKKAGDREVPDPNHPLAAKLRREGRNARQLAAWTVRPPIALPDVTATNPVIPDVLVHAYGADAEDGTPLLAYGTVAPNLVRRDPSDPYFVVAWTLKADDAQRWHDAAVTRLPVIAHELRELARIGAIMAERDRLIPLISGMVRNHGTDADLPEGLRTRVRLFWQQPRNPGDPSDVATWNGLATAILAEVSDALHRAAAHKAQAAGRTARIEGEAAALHARITDLTANHADAIGHRLWNELTAVGAKFRFLRDDTGRQAWIDRAAPLVREAEAARAAYRPAPVPAPATPAPAASTPAPRRRRLLGRK